VARTASGTEHVAAAHALLRNAKTADELRLAQAVLLPLELGLSIKQTAQAIGRSAGSTCSMRTHFGSLNERPFDQRRNKHDLRNHAHADLDVERQILDEVLAQASVRLGAVATQLKPAIEAMLGKVISLSSVYRMLARHGWCRSASNIRNASNDVGTRGEWKKTASPPRTKP